MTFDYIKSLIQFKNTINQLTIPELVDTLFSVKTEDDRQFIVSLLNYTLQSRQKQIISSPDMFQPSKTKVARSQKQLNIIAGIDGTGKSTFYATAPHFFEDTHYIEKKHHALYKACEKYFEAGRSLTIETKLTPDDTDLLPIIKLAREYDYIVSVFALEVSSVEILHTRLSHRDGSSPFTTQSLAANQFYGDAILGDLLNEADRLIVIDNTEDFELLEINWDSDL